MEGADGACGNLTLFGVWPGVSVVENYSGILDKSNAYFFRGMK